MRPKYDLGQWVQVRNGRFGKIFSRELYTNFDPPVWVYGVHLVTRKKPQESFNILIEPKSPDDVFMTTQDEVIPRDPPRVNQVEFEKWSRSQDPVRKAQKRVWAEKLTPDDGGRRSGPSRPTGSDDDPWSQLDMDDFNWMVFRVGANPCVDAVEDLDIIDKWVRSGEVGSVEFLKHHKNWGLPTFQDVWDAVQLWPDVTLPSMWPKHSSRGWSFGFGTEELLVDKRREARKLGVLPRRLGGEKEKI